MKTLDSLIQLFNDHGYLAYGVGGCVRDYLLNREIHDYDLATDATPDQMLVLFDGYLTTTMGKQYGTIGVYYQDQWFECTTFRKDIDSLDYRHPQAVSFNASLKEDVLRRDFTINALAYYQGDIIDYVNGQEDLQNKLIRSVGSPSLRFQEDALRLLRALRFASELGFRIEQSTLEAIDKHLDLLTHISKERITQELKRLVMGPYVNDGYFYLLERILNTKVNPIGNEKYFVSRLLRLAPDIDYKSLKLSKTHIKQIELIREYKDRNINLSKLVNNHGYENVLVLADYKNESVENITVKDLKITGHHLIDLNIEEKKRASLLNKLLEDVIDGKVNNDLSSLLKRLDELDDFR